MNSRSSGCPPDQQLNPDSLAFIALGSNLASDQGSPAETVTRAMERLASFGTSPLLRSSLWSSRPLDCPPGAPDFINAVVGLQPAVTETPAALLCRLQALETEFGRQRGMVRNSPRTLDLDLISFAGRRLNQPDLVLPHPAAHLRAFVQLPLAEIAPQLILPGQSLSAAELALILRNDPSQQVWRLAR